MKLGLGAPDLIRRLAARRDPNDKLAFLYYLPRDGVAQRRRIRPARMFYSRTIAQLLRRKPGIEGLLDDLIGGKLTDGRARRHWVRAGDLRAPDFPLPPPRKSERGRTLAFCSECRVNRRILHFPMLDLRAEAPKDQAEAAEALKTLARALIRNGAPSGAILHSGASYHYYGFDPQPKKLWRTFMTKCLLLEPLVDVRYIAHRLLSGRATLRISTSVRKSHPPHVVALIEGARCIVDPKTGPRGRGPLLAPGESDR